ncbi:MAG: undecaprenyl-diphosphate phosphatase [Phycisphaeraceae bacterium]|nr:undecaprenyl-diphosphate phosphatase [Phycisphaeraceae bacterium]
MTILDAIILGVVEGITEYLPVSSTGHLILTATLLGVGHGAPGDPAAAGDLQSVNEAVKSFEIVIQGGAILAVAGLYWKRVRDMVAALALAIAALAGRLGGARNAALLDEPTWRSLRLFRNLVVSFLPAAIVGVTIGSLIKRHLFYPGPVCAALLVGGVILIATGRWQRRRHAESRHLAAEVDDFPEVTLRQAIIIGFAQILALWPGTSRSMVTILGGVFSGLSPRRAAEYSFLLGLPTLGGATVYELLRAWRGAHSIDGGEPMRGWAGIQALVDGNGGWVPVTVGVVVAMISAALAIKWLVRWLQNHSLEIFGWWRIVVALGFIGAIWMGWITR